MKNKGFQIAFAAATSVSVFLSLGYSFFEFVVKNKKKDITKSKRIKKLYHAKVNHPRYKFEEEYESGKQWCQDQKMMDWYITSDDGLILHGSFLKASSPKRYVILCHGYKGSGFGDFANIARYLHENGCNLLFIDERCCGLSEGNYITFGAKEQYDIKNWAWLIAEHDGKKLPIYLFGESMGASSVLMATGQELPKQVKGIIADCGFCTMKAQLKNMAACWFHIKWIELLLLRMNILCRVVAKFRMDESDTTKALVQNKRPVLFFHGMKDTYVDPKNTEYNYSICTAEKELVLVPEARHLCCAYEAPKLYRRKIMNFFRHYDGF